MPPQKPNFLAKYGKALDDGIKAHANDEADYGFTRVPAGIIDGRARLTKCGWGQYKSGKNTGEWYFRAVGTVVEPHSVIVDGGPMVVEGLQTSIMEAVCQTSGGSDGKKVTTVAQHAANILGEMKKLAGSQYGQGATSGADLMKLAADLEATNTPPNKPIFFRFATSVRKALKPGDPDGVWENWNGSQGMEDYVPPDGQQMEDDTSAPEAEVDEADIPFEEPTQGEVEEPAAEEGVESEPETETEGGSEEPPDDLNALAAAADGGDEESQIRLSDLATEVGMDQAAIEGSDNWAALAQAILEAQPTDQAEEEAAEEEPEAEPEPPTPPKPAPKPVQKLKQVPTAKPAAAKPIVVPVKPKIKGVFRYQRLGTDKKPLIGKDKKPTKPVEVEVTSIDEKTKTANLKFLNDPKVLFKSVPWASLLPTK